MKPIHIVLILVTILSVFSRRHLRKRSSVLFDRAGNRTSNKMREHYIYKKISQTIDKPNLQCSDISEMVTGKQIKIIWVGYEIAATCKFDCDSFNSTAFNDIVNEAKRVTPVIDRVDKLISRLTDFEDNWINC